MPTEAMHLYSTPAPENDHSNLAEPRRRELLPRHRDEPVNDGAGLQRSRLPCVLGLEDLGQVHEGGVEAIREAQGS